MIIYIKKFTATAEISFPLKVVKAAKISKFLG